MRGMEPRILVGTEGGLRSFGSVEVPADALAGHTVTALAHDGSRTWAIVDGRTLYASENRREWTAGAAVEGEHEATCLAPTSRGPFVGTAGAHLHRLQAGRLSPLDSFETVEGRQTWYTPWGDPADVRSIAAERGAAVAIYVNVHVGGVVRSHDGGGSWTPTLDIEVDVHQVLVHPSRRGVVLVAAADGLGVSRDSGASWDFATSGLHGSYLRAVAVAGDTVLVTASTGPGGSTAPTSASRPSRWCSSSSCCSTPDRSRRGGRSRICSCDWSPTPASSPPRAATTARRSPTRRCDGACARRSSCRRCRRPRRSSGFARTAPTSSSPATGMPTRSRPARR